MSDFHKLIVFPAMAFALHTILVLYVAYHIYEGLASSNEVMMMWMVFMAIDFPGSIIILYLDEPISKHFYNNDTISYVIIPAVGFSLIGGMQYALIVWGLTKYFCQRRVKKLEEVD